MGNSQPDASDVPTLQRIYDNVWLIAVAGTLFFALSYVAWGIIDILAVPVG